MRFRHRLSFLILAATLACPPGVAADLPELGDVASGELSVQAEKKVGQQIMHEIRRQELSYLDDPDIESYLNQLGGRLSAYSADPGYGFYFFGINDLSINAFAMPGGYIGVHTGLILAAQGESELAGVLAHEISHVTQRHLARQLFQSKRIGMASMLAMGLALLAASSNPQAAGAAIATSQAGAMSSQLAFSRDFERESDRMGFEMLNKAGFDPRGMALFFERLQQTTRLYENNAGAYLQTHPLTSERIGDMQNRDQFLPYRQVPDSLDFLLVKARLRAMQGRADEAVRQFADLLAERKFQSEAATRYGYALALSRAQQWEAAWREIEAVRALRQSSGLIEHLAADIRIGMGDAKRGLQIYREAMLRYPLDRSLVYGLGAALVGSGQFADALRFAESQLRGAPGDVRLHRLRAQSHAGMGHRAMQHAALAETFALQGDTAGALNQLDWAQKAGDANFYESSAIEARVRELKLRHLDELKARGNSG